MPSVSRGDVAADLMRQYLREIGAARLWRD